MKQHNYLGVLHLSKCKLVRALTYIFLPCNLQLKWLGQTYIKYFPLFVVTRDNVGSCRSSSSSYGVENFRATIHFRRSILYCVVVYSDVGVRVCIES